MATQYLTDAGATFALTPEGVQGYVVAEGEWQVMPPEVSDDVLDGMHAGEYWASDTPPEGVPEVTTEETP